MTMTVNNRTPQYSVWTIRLCLAGVLSFSTAHSQDTLRVATYNLLNYPGDDAAVRNPHFRAVTKTMNPDILVVREMTSSSGVTGFLSNVLNAAQPGTYTSVPFNNGPDTDPSLFYKAAKVNYLGASYISTALRNIAEYRIIPAGHTDTVRIYAVHLKANEGDSLLRLAEATILRNHLNALPPGSKFIVAGDFNTYRSSEPAFQKLIGSEANNIGRCKDPINLIGNWHATYSFRSIHTQSTRRRDFGNGTTGGLDDRFDMILTSYSMDSLFVPGSYTTYGNDGNHFNDSINRLPNTSVPDSVANGLHYASDHLPVIARFRFGSAGGGTGFTSIASGNWNTPGVWSGGVVPGSSDNVVVAVGTTVAIDGAANCNTVTVHGVLQFDATDGRSCTCQGNLTIETGGELRASAAFGSGATTQGLVISGNFINSGTFTPRVTGSSSGTRVITVSLVGTGSSSIAGNTNPTSFYQLVMNKSSVSATVTPVIDVSLAFTVANALTLTRGTWVQNAGQTILPLVNVTVGSNAALTISDGGSFTTAASVLVNGMLEVSGGTLNIGSGNNSLQILGGAQATFLGGTITIAGRCSLATASATEISGCAIAINPRGLGPNSYAFEATASASLTMTNGSLTIAHPKVMTGSGCELRVLSGAGVKNFTGGTIYFGVGTGTLAGSDSGFVIESSVPLCDVVLQTGGGVGRDVSIASPLSVRSLTLASGGLRLTTFSPGFDLTLGGSLSRTGGTLQVGQRTVTLAGGSTSSIIGGYTGANAFYRLVANNSADVLVQSPVEVTENLTVLSGRVDTDTSSIILGSNATLVETPGHCVVGRVATVRSLLQAVSNTFGGLGVSVNALDAAPGLTSVLRQTGVASLFGAGQSILRNFTISPTTNTGLNATLVFSYDDTELNTNNSSILRLWKSTDVGASWSDFGGTTDTSARTVTVGGVESFSLWTAADTLHFQSGAVTRGYPMRAGWNMISLPLSVPDNTRAAVFPTSTSFAYAFTTAQGYVQRDTLVGGVGYWLKFGSQQDVTITGVERPNDTVSVTSGWNMIGAASLPALVDSIRQIPAGIVISDYYGFNDAYVPADTLRPASGYWVKVSQNGRLVLR